MNDREKRLDNRLDEALLTAYALGELEGGERALVETMLQANSEAQHSVANIRALAGHLRQAALGENLFAPSAGLRGLMETQFDEGLAPARSAESDRKRAGLAPRHRLWAILAMAAAAALVLAVTIPSLPMFQKRTPTELAIDLSSPESGVASRAPAQPAEAKAEAGLAALGVRELAAAKDPAEASFDSIPIASAEPGPAPPGEPLMRSLRVSDEDPQAPAAAAPGARGFRRAAKAPEEVEEAAESHSKNEALMMELPEAAPYRMPGSGPSDRLEDRAVPRFAGRDAAGRGMESGREDRTMDEPVSQPLPQAGSQWRHSTAPVAPKGDFTPGQAAGSGVAATPKQRDRAPTGPAILSERLDVDVLDVDVEVARPQGNQAGGLSGNRSEDRRLQEGNAFPEGESQALSPAPPAAGEAYGLGIGRGAGPAPAAQPLGGGYGGGFGGAGYGAEDSYAPSTPGRPSTAGFAFDSEQYEPVVENPFQTPLAAPESTVSIDVDTASYANVRRMLQNNQIPPPDAVRIEEMINYFRYDYPQPTGEHPFSVDVEVAGCPWNSNHRLARIGLKAKEIDTAERGPSNLVFLIDVSGSMRDANKLPLVKDALAMLVDQLTEDDRVSIVTYAGEAGLALEPTEGTKRKEILQRIEALKAGGSTHGSAGIQMAYEQALAHFVPGGNNRVILCTDGDLNVGITDDDELVELIRQQASSGVFLTVVGFGTGNLKDAKLEKLADKGNGNYAYVDGLAEARKVFLEQASGSLVTVAKDVKTQIEFNPAEVASYRLIGYENRRLAASDFDDDMKDAGEMGAGDSVTYLYEIVPVRDAPAQSVGLAQERADLRYQRRGNIELAPASGSGELLMLKVRYKLPDEPQSQLLEFSAKDTGKSFGEASEAFRFAAAVASFGLLLRGSQYNQELTFSAVEEFAAGAAEQDAMGLRSEFVDLVRQARSLYGEADRVPPKALMLPSVPQPPRETPR